MGIANSMRLVRSDTVARRYTWQGDRLPSFGLHLSQQRRLLCGRPLPPPLNPRNDLHVHRSGLLLELQKEAPQEANIAAKAALRYTWQGGRLLTIEGAIITIDAMGPSH